MFTVLLATDGSECSRHAVEKFIEHASWFREPPQVHLFYVHPPLPIGARISEHVGHDAIERYYREEGEAALAPAEPLLSAAKIPFTRHIHVGPVAEVLLKHAHELKCAMIVMGSHGRGAIGNAVMGSVATKLLQLSDIPVLVVK